MAGHLTDINPTTQKCTENALGARRIPTLRPVRASTVGIRRRHLLATAWAALLRCLAACVHQHVCRGAVIHWRLLVQRYCVVGRRTCISTIRRGAAIYWLLPVLRYCVVSRRTCSACSSRRRHLLAGAFATWLRCLAPTVIASCLLPLVAYRCLPMLPADCCHYAACRCATSDQQRAATSRLQAFGY